MGVEIGVAYLSVVPSAEGFGRKLDAEIGRQTRGVGAKHGQQIGGDLGDGIDRGMNQRLGSVLRSVTGFAVKAGAIIGGAGLAVSAFGLKSAADLQQTTIAFEGIFGSASAANDFLGELRKFAAKTPFEFPELATASKQLLAVGFSAADVIPIMTKLGNVAATLGVGGEAINGVVRALGQMKGKGKASAEELQQISEQIPGFSAIGAIADSMGITVAEAFDQMAAGAIPADAAITAILAGMEKFPGAAGAMERQSVTLNGVLSTLKDTLRDALTGGLGPVLPELAGSIAAVAPILGQALGALAGTFGQLLGGLAPILETLLPPLAQIAQVISGVLLVAFDALQPSLGIIGPLLAQIAGTLGGILAHAFELLEPVLPPIVNILGILANTVLGVLADVLKDLGPPLSQMAQVIGGALVGAVQVLSPAISQVAGVLAKSLGKVLEQLAPMLPELARAFVEIAASFGQILIALTPVIPPLVRLGTLFLREISVPLMVKLAEALGALSRALVPIATAVGGILSAGLAEVAGFLQRMVDAIKALDLGAVVAFFEQIPGAIGGALSTLGSTIGDLFGSAVSGALDIVNDIGGQIIGFFEGLPGRITDFADDMLLAGLGLGGSIIQGIKDGITGAAEGIADIADAVLGTFKDAWNEIADVINDFIPNSVGFDTPFGFVGVDLPDNPLPKFHKGGLVPGGPGQQMAALLEGGEFVIPRHAVTSAVARAEIAVSAQMPTQGPLIGVVNMNGSGSTTQDAFTLAKKLRTYAMVAGH